MGNRTAVIYLRDQQGQQNDAQEEACRAYASAHGMEVAGVYQDTASGATANRPGLQKALDALTPESVLIVSDLARLTRSARDLPTLIDRLKRTGATLATVEGGQEWNASTPEGELFDATIKLHLAEYERALTDKQLMKRIASCG